MYTCHDGVMFNVVKYMYTNSQSKAKPNIETDNCSICNLGLIQAEILSPFVFTVNVYDFRNSDCLTVESLEVYLLMDAEDIVLFSESADG